MRDVTRRICEAFFAGRTLRIKNTSTDGEVIRLHNSIIAKKTRFGVEITLAGYNTTTTRERVNGIYQLLTGRRPFHSKSFEPHFDDKPISTLDWFLVESNTQRKE